MAKREEYGLELWGKTVRTVEEFEDYALLKEFWFLKNARMELPGEQERARGQQPVQSVYTVPRETPMICASLATGARPSWHSRLISIRS